LLSGIIIALVYEWRIALVTLAVIPFLITTGAIQMKFYAGFSERSDAIYKHSSNLIMEAMVNIRTVYSFGMENTIALKYEKKLEEPLSLATKKGNVSGILYGLCQTILMVAVGVVLYIITLFIRKYHLQFVDMFTAVYAIGFAARTTGLNMQFVPDIASGKNSAANLFEILDGKDEEQMQIESGSTMMKEGGGRGQIEFKSVTFRYPSHKNYTFIDLSLQIPPGTKVALVGPSGCGKSTITQMILRFYEPESGNILLDGRNIKDYDLYYLRGLFGVVSQ